MKNIYDLFTFGLQRRHMRTKMQEKCHSYYYLLDAVGSSGILKAKQKLGVTFNFDKQDVIDLTKISKMTMCRASKANSEK